MRAYRPGPDLRGVSIEDRLIFGRHGLFAKGLGHRIIVENLRQRDKPVEGTRVALQRLFSQAEQHGFLRRNLPRLSLLTEF